MVLLAGAVCLLNVPVCAGETPYFTNCPAEYISGECISVVSFDFDAEDPDPDSTIRYSLGPATPGSVDSITGVWEWSQSCQMGLHDCSIIATDNEAKQAICYFEVFIDTEFPQFTACPTESSQALVIAGQQVSGAVVAVDPDNCPESITYSLVSFDGPGALHLEPETGEWTWLTHVSPEFNGEFEMCIEASDGFHSDFCTFNLRALPVFNVWIGALLDQQQGQFIDVPIYLADSTDYLAGFDFLVSYDGRVLTFVEAELGSDLGHDGCRWEYFTYRYVSGGGCSGPCPENLLRFVALAEFDLKPPYPLCYGGGPLELLNMRYLTANGADYQGTFAPIEFYWLDCGDNTVSSVSGDSLWLSKDVYVWDATLIPTYFLVTGRYGIGGHTGLEAVNCLSGNIHGSQPFEGIVFRSGGIRTEYIGDVIFYGDLNVNRVPNEVSDVILYISYFQFGLDVFIIDPDFQIEASDVNRDGRVLSSGDLVYMIRILLGDVSPVLKSVSLAGNVCLQTQRQDDGSIVIYTEADEELGALYLETEVGDEMVTPSLINEQMEMKWNIDDGILRAIVYSMSGNSVPVGRQSLIRLEGVSSEITFLNVDASDAYGNSIRVEIEESSPSNSIELLSNYPNPFNASTEIVFSLPTPGEWSLEVFNTLGQSVAEYKGLGNAGMNRVYLNASDLSSGVYFYRLNALGQSRVNKMILMK